MTNLKKLTATFALAATLVVPAGTLLAQSRSQACATDQDVVRPLATLTLSGDKLTQTSGPDLGLKFEHALSSGIVQDVAAPFFQKNNIPCDKSQFHFLLGESDFNRLDGGFGQPSAEDRKMRAVIIDFNGTADNKDLPVFEAGNLEMDADHVVVINGSSYEEMIPRVHLSSDTLRKIEKAGGFVLVMSP